MVALPQAQKESIPPSTGCGKSCGAGLEKVYPTTAVRYGAMNWIGEFAYKPGTVFSCGAKVVIETDRGVEIGQQVSVSCGGCSKSISRDQIKSYIDESGPEFYRLRAGKILREATPDDLNDHEHLNGHTKEDVNRCALLAAQMQLDLKVITAEHLLGGERIVFYFRSETRVDFRDLVKELAHYFHTRIEMRQVGARDEARLVADYEICGRECCCKNFLKKLRPVNMKMAKTQKSTLDPSKVSGRCGRLRCCLRYEHEGYESLAAKLPRVGATVGTSFGNARVIDRQILTQLVMVRTEDDRVFTIPIEEIEPHPRRDRSPTDPSAPAGEAPARGEGRPDNRGGDGRRDRRRRDERPPSRRDAGTDAVEPTTPSEAPQAGEAPQDSARNAEADTPPAADRGAEDGAGRKRKRGRGRGRRAEGDSAPPRDSGSASADQPTEGAGPSGEKREGGPDGKPRRKRRRGRGRRGGPDGGAGGPAGGGGGDSA